ncbi:hypothetical protein Lesp02_71100 [Lentzea sp. NBRC 105346]|uniref:hypothetical protein n=1 Tax=Lentzea sp. NBRC 105346 TaxID=3032205 RepID=UPI0024A04554|nr:hypothetical protein [Lentzea sp. NBRC 105346]GLZ34923.1 hypothetical protein Lesp02_71100 [Lentzea sp. NBRC 105346]
MTEAELVALVIDDAAEVPRRMSAMRALAAMGNSAGYCGVAAVVAMGTEIDWYPRLAEAVAGSRAHAVRNGTVQRRVDAVHGMVLRCDEFYFGEHLALALDDHTLPHVADDLAAAIARGLERLGEPRSFDLGRQLAGLTAVLGVVDGRSAVLLGQYFED